VPLAITMVSATSVSPRTSNTLTSRAFISSSALMTTFLSEAVLAAANFVLSDLSAFGLLAAFGLTPAFAFSAPRVPFPAFFAVVFALTGPGFFFVCCPCF
jgi:hypothetical protein